MNCLLRAAKSEILEQDRVRCSFPNKEVVSSFIRAHTREKCQNITGLVVARFYDLFRKTSALEGTALLMYCN